MYKKNFILSLSFVFVLGIFIVSVINNTYAMPTNLLNGGNNNGMQFLGAGGEFEYPMMNCTITYSGCDDSTMQSGCNSVGGTLSGNTCTWEMVNNGVNRCGDPIQYCENEEPEEDPVPTGQCYSCTTESWLYSWSLNGNAPALGSNGCSGAWASSLVTEENCVNKTPPAEEDRPTYYQYCYTCSTEDTIFRRYAWEYNKPVDGTDSCRGWNVDVNIDQANCKDQTKRCYVCDNYYYWGYEKPTAGTNSCVGWEVYFGISKENCKSVTPEPVPEEKCYKCKTDDKLFYWGTEPKTGSNNCSGAWQKETNINEERNCKYVASEPVPEKNCYKCETDNKLFYWGTDPKIGSNNCSGAWQKENDIKEEKNCKYIEPEVENPPTGNTLLYVFYVIELIALSYTGFCAYKILKTKKNIE